MEQISFIFLQLLAVAAISLLVWYTIRPVSRRAIMSFNIVINLLWAGHYMLLKAYSGAVCSVFCALMVWVFSYKGKRPFLSKLAVPLFFAIMFLAGGLLTWQGIGSLLPIMGNILLVIAMWRDREWTIKAICILVAALWVVYNWMNRSLIGGIGQTLSLIANLVYVATHHRQDTID